MYTSPTITSVAPALIRAQANIGAASKDAKNPFYSSTYADLGSVMAVCKEPLLAQGISVLQPLTTRENGDIVLETILLHESGEFIGSSMKITPQKRMITPKSDKERFEPYLAPDPQAEGSAITYARRYALQALVFIPSVDDDAEWAARALANRPLPPETLAKLGAAVDQTITAAETTTDEAERQRLHKEAMKLEKGTQQRTPEAVAIAAYEDEHPEHRNKVACASQDDKGNWTFTLIGGEQKPAKATRAKRQTPAEGQTTTTGTSQPPETPWREFICLRGTIPGAMNGHTLGELFETGKRPPKNALELDKLVGWFVAQSIPTSSDSHDQTLWVKVNDAKAEMTAKFAQGAPQTPASTTTSEPTPEAPRATASATDWRKYEIASRSPDWHGKKLGALSPEDLKRLKSEYIDQIDVARATLAQKSLIANVSMAIAEMFPAKTEPDPHAGLPDHTATLLDSITKNKWDRGFFLHALKLNTWVSDHHRKVEDITENEFESLAKEWNEVEAAVNKAHQPAQQP